jgi:L-ascorbate metabolism protein UlaG (beta-lactamase superfamily)
MKQYIRIALLCVCLLGVVCVMWLSVNAVATDKNMAKNGEFMTDKFITKNGREIAITFIKHASLILEVSDSEKSNENSTIIQIDPVSTWADYAKFKKADYIFVTHEHFDHFDKKALTDSKTDRTKIIINASSNKIMQEWKGFNNATVMANGDKIELTQNFTVQAVPAYNPNKPQFHPNNGRDNGYILDIDGFRIYIAGDTEDIPEMKNIKNIDVAFLPVNQPYTMTPKQAINAAEMIKPKILYPYHYNETKFGEEFFCELKSKGVEVRMRGME